MLYNMGFEVARLASAIEDLSLHVARETEIRQERYVWNTFHEKSASCSTVASIVYGITFFLLLVEILAPQLTSNERKDDHAGLPKDRESLQHHNRVSPDRAVFEDDPDRQESDCKEMVEQDERPADDASKETNWLIDTFATELEVGEAASLKGTKGRVCSKSLASYSRES